MTLPEFKETASIVEHWPSVARAVDEYLVSHLVETCLGADGGEKAQTEIGAQKAIANLIKTFRSLASKPKDRKEPRTRQLHRFSGDETKPGEIKNPT